MKQPEISLLNPHAFAGAIRRDPEFLRSLPQIPVAELDHEEFREQRQRALAKGALSIADKLERKNGEYDLNANLFKLVGSLGDFQRNSDIVESLREKYGGANYMPSSVKDQFYDSKDKLTAFNHILREVINVSASKFNFDQLLGFMTAMYLATGNREDASQFHRNAQTTLVGMRNEMSFEQLLIAGGYDYKLGSLEQDAEGSDVFIEGVPFDLKASEFSTERARQKARDNGYFNDNILWSHIEPEDYEGQLTLPYKNVNKVLARLKPDLDRALESRTRQYA